MNDQPFRLEATDPLGGRVPEAVVTRRITIEGADLKPFTGSLMVLLKPGQSAGLLSWRNPEALVLNTTSGMLARQGSEARLTRPLADIVIAVFGRRSALSRAELVEAVYQDRDDGGPLSDVVSARLVHLRPILARLGLGLLVVRFGALRAGAFALRAGAIDTTGAATLTLMGSAP